MARPRLKRQQTLSCLYLIALIFAEDQCGCLDRSCHIFTSTFLAWCSGVIRLFHEMSQDLFRTLQQQHLSAAYPLVMLQVAAEYGISATNILAHTGLTDLQLQQPSARITGWQKAMIIANLLKYCDDPALGLVLGLRATPTKLGLIGFGLMSCATYGEALALAQRYIPILVPFFSLSRVDHAETVELIINSNIELIGFHAFTFDHVLTEIWAIFKSLIAPHQQQILNDVVLCFDRPRDRYVDRFRLELPALRWNQPINSICFPCILLDQAIPTANRSSAQLVIDQCERELSLLGYTTDIVDKVRYLLVCHEGMYPDLLSVAAQLHVSERTLKRRLQEQGLSFQKILDQQRLRDSQQLLRDTHLTIDQVAYRVGYQNPTNFCRAFRRWTTQSPHQYRQSTR
jgi:AraC-like DNA-binding protein